MPTLLSRIFFFRDFFSGLFFIILFPIPETKLNTRIAVRLGYFSTCKCPLELFFCQNPHSDSASKRCDDRIPMKPLFFVLDVLTPPFDLLPQSPQPPFVLLTPSPLSLDCVLAFPVRSLLCRNLSFRQDREDLGLPESFFFFLRIFPPLPRDASLF